MRAELIEICRAHIFRLKATVLYNIMNMNINAIFNRLEILHAVLIKTVKLPSIKRIIPRFLLKYF